jgi:hypothetical protein
VFGSVSRRGALCSINKPSTFERRGKCLYSFFTIKLNKLAYDFVESATQQPQITLRGQLDIVHHGVASQPLQQCYGSIGHDFLETHIYIIGACGRE